MGPDALGSGLSAVRSALPRVARLTLLLSALAALVVGVWAGLTRLGWFGMGGAAMAWHGPLMVVGFFLLLIALERAVALHTGWAFAAPTAVATGSLAAAVGLSTVAPWLYTLGALALLAATLAVWHRQRERFAAVLALAAACGAAGTLVWAAGLGVHAAVLAWAAFLVLTIAAERLELTRVLPPSPGAQRAFAAIVALLLLALAAQPVLGVSQAARGGGVALLLMALWLLRCDIARRQWRRPGLTGYMARALLGGYAWLGLSGALLAARGLPPAGPWADAALHTLWVGFVVSMVMAHAPIVLPAVLGSAQPWRPWLYLPLVLLHATLALRVVGDMTGSAEGDHLRRWGAWGNVLALVLFVLLLALGLVLARRTRAHGRRPDCRH